MGKVLIVSALPALPAFTGIKKVAGNGTTYWKPLHSLDYLILTQAGKLMNCSFVYKAPAKKSWS